MRTTVLTPNDSMFVLEKFNVETPDSCRQFVYKDVGNVLVAPSSFVLKDSDVLGVEIGQTHPAWLYSGLDYHKPYITGDSIFREHAGSLGVPAPVFAPNIKHLSQVSSLAGGLRQSKHTMRFHDNLPINYYGMEIDKKIPTDLGPKTILTKVIDESKLKVTCISPCEYEIEVLTALADDEWFYLPEGNPKGLTSTIWGEVGDDSTLPPGASAGLVKVRTETVLDASLGFYKAGGTELAAVMLPSKRIYERTDRIKWTDKDTPPDNPVWYDTLATDILQSQTQWQTLKSMYDAGDAWYVCGYRTGTSTVGTGLFVKNNKPATMSIGKSMFGVNYRNTVRQRPDNYAEDLKVETLMDTGDFLKQLSTGIDSAVDVLPLKAVIPFAAAELQLESKVTPGSYHPLQSTDFNYPYMFHDTIMPVSTTPVYWPVDQYQHGYTPLLACAGSTKVSMLATDRPDDWVSLGLFPHTSWLQASNSVPKRITLNATLTDMDAKDPTDGYHRDQFGFEYKQVKGKTGVFSVLGDWMYDLYTYTGTIDWVSSDPDPTTGRDYLTSNDRPVNNVLLSAMVTAFTGIMPAGTSPGKYLWKPFKTVEPVSGCLVGKSPEYAPSSMIAKIKPETTTVPYMGVNAVTVDYPNINWSKVLKSDGVYAAHQVLKNVAKDKTKTTRLADTFLFTISMDTVPLVGYPLTHKPMLIDLDDNTGDWACDVDDLAMTTPFWDEHIDKWVIVAASAQLGKMYRIEVEMDTDNSFVTSFLRVRDSRPLFDTPYGNFTAIHGLCHTRDIHYVDGVEDNHLVIYGQTTVEDSQYDKGTNLVIATCRTYMEWDSDRDTISRVRISDVLPEDFVIDPDINWPRGVAVMYPYIYILGFSYQNMPTSPVVDELLTQSVVMSGEGWQMALWKIDITSGAINDVMIIKDCTSMRFTYGLPAFETDARKLHRADHNSIDGVMKYAFGPVDPKKLPASMSLPLKSKGWQHPTIAGISCVSGTLMAFSNYDEKMCLINPITGFIETAGTNIFPFTYPFNSNVASNGDIVSVISKFGGKAFYTAHPFFHVCMGDGLPPNRFGAGIDIQDITEGFKLVRLVKLRNNLLRDQILEANIIVPPETELPGSDMMWLSSDGDPTNKVKSLILDKPIQPSDTANFYLHIEPAPDIYFDDSVLLYLNVKFGRETVYFGYRLRIGEIGA